MFLTCCIKRKTQCFILKDSAGELTSEWSVILDRRIHGDQWGSLCFSSIGQTSLFCEKELWTLHGLHNSKHKIVQEWIDKAVQDKITLKPPELHGLDCFHILTNSKWNENTNTINNNTNTNNIPLILHILWLTPIVEYKRYIGSCNNTTQHNIT